MSRYSHLRKELGITSIFHDIERASLRWLGHVERMQENRIPKIAFNYKPNSKRPLARPNKRCRDNIQEILTKHKIGKITTLEEDRIFEDREEGRRRC